MYWNGRGVVQIMNSCKLVSEAADRSKMPNLFLDGCIKGRVPQDDKIAATWFQKAADQGNADAQYNLAGLYREG